MSQSQQPPLAIAALVLGILSIPSCICYGCPSLICGILAVIFGAVVLSQVSKGQAPPNAKGLAIAGICTGGVGIVFSGMFWVLGFLGIAMDGGF